MQQIIALQLRQTKMEEAIRVPIDKISLDDFKIIKDLLVEWEWNDTIKYDVVHSSDDENPIITFYIPKDVLGDFFGTMFFMGAESVFRRH